MKTQPWQRSISTNSKKSQCLVSYDPADVPGKSALVLAGVYISDETMQRVVEFNRSNNQYRIVVKNAEEYDTEEELAQGVLEMTNSILSGNMPDILVTEGLPAKAYAAKGYLADIGALISEDEELSPNRFQFTVFTSEMRKALPAQNLPEALCLQSDTSKP